MTFWNSDAWKQYEAAYGSTVSRVDELAASDWLTHVVDLSKSEAELWQAIPKTMRQAIRKGFTLWSVRGKEHGATFFDYVRTHQIAFDSPRPDETYNQQRLLLRDGKAFVYAAFMRSDDTVAVGAILVFVHGAWSYFASGPSLERGVMPALIWSSMLECKRRGIRYYEVGWVGHAKDEKGKNIERFKQRWGGVNMPAKEAPMLAFQERDVVS